MKEFLHSALAQAVIWITALLILGSVGIYLVRLVRERSEGDGELSSSDMLTGFRDLHEVGEISQTEFKRIKSVLGGKLHDETGSNDAGGDG
jgi:hypothetical protein